MRSLLVACLLHAVSADAGFSSTLQRPGAKVLYLEVPLKSGFLKAPKYAVAPGLSLDASRNARVWIGYYDTAHVSWMGDPASASPQNVPHHEITIQFPVTYNGKQFHQTVYHLTDDDVAMLHYRDTQGAPSKLANFTFSTDKPSHFSVTRRTDDLVIVGGSTGKQIDAGSADLLGLFDNTLNLFGTQAVMPKSIPFYGTNPMNSVFLHIRNSIKVKTAWEFNVDVMSVLNTHHEPIADFFESSVKPTKAYWLEADIGADSDPVPANIGTAANNLLDLKYFLDNFMFKYGGKQVNAGIPKTKGNPFEWENGRFLWVSVKVKPEMAQKQLPPGAILADDTAHLFCAYYPTATLLGAIGAADKSVVNDNFPYHELGIRLQAKMPDGTTYHHVTYILVDDDVPLLTGRDMLGTPKKMMSKIVFPDGAENLNNGAKVNMYIERRGAVVLNFTGIIGDNRTDTVPGMTDGIKDVSVFANGVPFYFNKTAPDAAPLYVKWFGSHDVHENRAVNDASITFGTSVHEPLDSWLVSGAPLAAGFFRMDYGKADDLKSRPVIGAMPAGDEVISYWRNIYQSHYGGGAAPAPATTMVI